MRQHSKFCSSQMNKQHHMWKMVIFLLSYSHFSETSLDRVCVNLLLDSCVPSVCAFIPKPLFQCLSCYNVTASPDVG